MVLFVCGHQLITAFEKAMVLMDPVPGEEHKKISADYLKCLSKVCTPSLPSLSLSQQLNVFIFIRIGDLMLDNAQLFLNSHVHYTFALSCHKKNPK